MAHFPGKARRRAAGFFIVFTILAFLTAGGVFPVQAGAEPVAKPNPEQLKKILADFETLRPTGPKGLAGARHGHRHRPGR